MLSILDYEFSDCGSNPREAFLYHSYFRSSQGPYMHDCLHVCFCPRHEANSFCLKLLYHCFLGCSRIRCAFEEQFGRQLCNIASAGNRARVTSMATMYSTTRPLMHGRSEEDELHLPENHPSFGFASLITFCFSSISARTLTRLKRFSISPSPPEGGDRETLFDFSLSPLPLPLPFLPPPSPYPF